MSSVNIVKCAWCGALTVKVISLSRVSRTVYHFCCLEHRDLFWENLQETEVVSDVGEESGVPGVRALIGYKRKDGGTTVYSKE